MKTKCLVKVGIFSAGVLFGSMFMLNQAKRTIENQPQPAFHEHADFAMYLNGDLFDFSKDEFMSVTPCKVAQTQFGISVAHAHGGDRDTVKEFVHLHDNIGGVVHAHKEGIDWSDFFVSLGMSFDDKSFSDDQGNTYINNGTSEFRFFVNGVEVETIAQREIRDNDKVLISYGRINRDETDFAFELASITNDACFYSETCLHRGGAPYESCGGGEPEQNFIERYLDL